MPEKNPYDFVPFEGMPDFVPESDHSRYTGFSGVIEFTLHTLTPLVINQQPPSRDNQTGVFAHLHAQNGKKTLVIPATSLKGMLRGIHEVVTNSRCGSLTLKVSVGDAQLAFIKDYVASVFASPYLPVAERQELLKRFIEKVSVSDRRNLTEHFDQLVKTSGLTTDDKSVTASELLFGRVSGRDQSSESSVKSFSGKVLVHDILFPSTLLQTEERFATPQGGPDPTHTPFYFFNQKKMLGRKFYYHQRDYTYVLNKQRDLLEAQIKKTRDDIRRSSDPQSIKKAEQRLKNLQNTWATIEWLPAGTLLPEGQITFVNLDRSELEALIYALILEWDDQQRVGLAHKLGYGKPLGLGSVRFEINKLWLEQCNDTHIPTRFSCYAVPRTLIEKRDIEALRDTAKRRWIQRHKGSYAAFATIMRYPQSQAFLYPGYPFPSETLCVYQQRGQYQYHPGDPNTVSAVPEIRDVPLPDCSTSPCRSQETLIGLSIQEPILPPDAATQSSTLQRWQGMLGSGSTGGYAVFDGDTELPVHTAGTSGKLIKKQISALRAGVRIPVSYRRENSQHGVIASDLKEEQ